MRIKIVFTPLTEPSFMPLDQHALADLLYRTVGLVAPDYATFLHDEGYSAPPAAGKAHKTFKLFTFSRPFLPDRLLNKGHEDRAWFARGKVVWQVSSPQLEFIEAVTVGLMAQPVIMLRDRLGAVQFAVESIEEMLPPPLGAQVRFTTLSPVTVAVTETEAGGQRRKQFLGADDPRFGPLVVANLQEKYRALLGAEPPEELQFAFDEAYIERRGGVRKVSKLVPYKGTNIRAWQAPFTVTGAPALIRLGWEAGFGEANSKGFGMAEAAPLRASHQ